jgi:nitroreductase
MKVHKLISDRKSIRAFSDRRIDDEKLITLLEAARWAASSMNEQPWRFIIVRRENEEAFNRMLESMNEQNRRWAQNASVIILTLASKKFASIGITNEYAWHDVGLAVGNLSLQAMSMDIYLHQIGGFNKETAKQLFHVPDDFEPVSMIVLGYRGDTNILPPPLRERELMPRKRKPLSELVFINNFGMSEDLYHSPEEQESE